MMNNKLKAVAALAICGMIAVGGTLAYMSNTTNTAKNVFTIGSGITGEVTEPNWPGKDGKDVVFKPGSTIAKDPQITNQSEGDAAYVGLKLEYVIDEVEAFKQYKANNPKTTFTSISQVYTKVGATDAESYIKAITSITINEKNTKGTWVNITGTNKYYYAELDSTKALALGTNATSDPLFREVVIKNKVGANNAVEMNTDTMLPFEIKVTGYLVQGDLDAGADPVTELSNLMGA